MPLELQEAGALTGISNLAQIGMDFCRSVQFINSFKKVISDEISVIKFVHDTSQTLSDD